MQHPFCSCEAVLSGQLSIRRVCGLSLCQASTSTAGMLRAWAARPIRARTRKSSLQVQQRCSTDRASTAAHSLGPSATIVKQRTECQEKSGPPTRGRLYVCAATTSTMHATIAADSYGVPLHHTGEVAARHHSRRAEATCYGGRGDDYEA